MFTNVELTIIFVFSNPLKFGDFLENQFVSDHVSRIRELSGHLTNLVPMVQEESSKDLALYLFDQSLV